ncbi:MAG: SUF system Fe-S cluster assembly protein [Candidatus Sumerlaeia bacterium]|nr:SUF system Fe-S cluster assembly protein [Candidatus Sumerlaeia bacterium]
MSEPTPLNLGKIRDGIVEQLKTVFDPEIPVNIYELGLIYDIEVLDTGFVNVTMTLTSPNCPAAESLPAEVDQKVTAVEGVTEAKIHIVWEPSWTPDMMSEEAKLELNMF